MKILFAATGEIAVPTLKALANEGLVKAVFTAPDAQAGRGRELIKSPIKIASEELGIPASSPEHLGKTARVEASLTGCDTLLSFCYGKIFGPKFLSLFPHAYNIHPSLLPKYRGPSPIFGAIKNGDRESGISLQRIALSCDEGAVLKKVAFPLEGTETVASLEAKVAPLASKLAIEFFKNPSACEEKEQTGEVSWSPLIVKDDGKLDFSKTAFELHCQIRACNPYPKAFCTFKGEPLYILGAFGSAFDIESVPCSEKSGTVVAFEKARGFKIATASGYLYVTKLQKPARKVVDALSFNNGNHDFLGTVLS